jgi:adenylate cyclase
VGEELRRSGVMTVWHIHSPDVVAKTEVEKSPYRLDKEAIIWHPFLSTTTLVPPVGFWVSYDPDVAAYPRHSYIDALKGAAAEHFKDKIVIIGFDAEIDPTSDTYSIPSLPGKASAAEMVACATQTLLDGRTMATMPRWLSVLVMTALIFASALVTGLMKPVRSAFAFLSLLLLYYAFATAAYRAGVFPDCAIVPAVAMLTAVAGGTGNAWLSLRMRRRIVDLFGRYVPRAVVNQMLQRPELEALALGGTIREVTVMFADIRGFTAYSQDMSPDEVVRELNGLLKIMVDCTFENEGTLDKFIGDAILVLFNAPLDQPDHSDRAIRTALMIQQRLTSHDSKLRVGVGVHRGDAVVGNVGTPERMEYTAIGSTVNIASRLCDSARPGEVVASKAVVEALTGVVKAESLGALQVKGISHPLEAARVTSVER